MFGPAPHLPRQPVASNSMIEAQKRSFPDWRMLRDPCRRHVLFVQTDTLAFRDPVEPVCIGCAVAVTLRKDMASRLGGEEESR